MIDETGHEENREDNAQVTQTSQILINLSILFLSSFVFLSSVSDILLIIKFPRKIIISSTSLKQTIISKALPNENNC